MKESICYKLGKCCFCKNINFFSNTIYFCNYHHKPIEDLNNCIRKDIINERDIKP